jgi:hypothetical protein
MVYGSGFRVKGLQFRDMGSKFKVQGSRLAEFNLRVTG